ncbi:hypothetical protein C8R44DRAFT_894109 [Mycena epipterygia]|nr:hypothetical protein C8R44DRAFT_894109 [Mycena epipterygia]
MSRRQKPFGPSLPVGIPREMNTRINHLTSLLKSLPSSLPLDPAESTYHFKLDPDDVKEEGGAYAFNRALELAFQTHKLRDSTLVFTERGKRVLALEIFLKKTVKEMTLPDARSHQICWVERLITAAKDSGAKIPPPKRLLADSDEEQQESRPQKKKYISVESSDDEHASDMQPLCTTSSPIDQRTPATATQPTATIRSVPQRQATLFQLGCKKLDPKEAAAQRKKHLDAKREKMQAAAERQKQAKIRTAAHTAELNRERQQRFRDRKKLQSNTKKIKKKLLSVAAPTTKSSDLNVAELSRPGGMAWKKRRTGEKKGVIQKRHERVNWFHPFLWNPIDDLAPRVVYGRLYKGTVSKWMSKAGKHWSTKTKKHVERRHRLTGTGRVGVLTPYPALVEAIKTKLTGLRASGICVGRLMARSIILTMIREQQPQLLETFKCSETYTGGFLQSVMNWSVRHGTHAASHVPDDAPALCEKVFFRLVHLINYYDIPPSLIVNMDQTGVLLLIANNKTYDEKGTRQVDIYGRDEKRAYTLAVASTPSGNILPFQQIWSGASKRSLPADDATGMAEAKALGFHFAFAKSKKKTSHFSTFKTMDEWMKDILEPYIRTQIEILSLEDDQKAILYIDVYPVHTLHSGG